MTKVYAEMTDAEVAAAWLKRTNQAAVDWKTLQLVMEHPSVRDLVVFDPSVPTYRLRD